MPLLIMLTKNNEFFFDKSFLFSQGASKSTASSSKSPHLDSGSRAWLPIDTISYGVQDLVYTRVFSLIVVQDCTDIRVQNNNIPFVCYAFVCDSRQVNKVRFFFFSWGFHRFQVLPYITIGTLASIRWVFNPH